MDNVVWRVGNHAVIHEGSTGRYLLCSVSSDPRWNHVGEIDYEPEAVLTAEDVLNLTSVTMFPDLTKIGKPISNTDECNCHCGGWDGAGVCKQPCEKCDGGGE